MKIVPHEKYIIYGVGNIGLGAYGFINLCDGEVLYVCNSDKQKQGNKILLLFHRHSWLKRGKITAKLIIASVHYQEIEESSVKLEMLSKPDFYTMMYILYIISFFLNKIFTHIKNV